MLIRCDELAQKIAEADKVEDAGKATTGTRVGRYIKIRKGLSSQVWFVGRDTSEPHEPLIVEWTGQ